MKIKLHLVIICIFSLLILDSCKDNEFEDVLFRTPEDPFLDVPNIDSLLKENTIFLDWKDDISADKFYLMRSDDASTLNFKCIYEGKETSYVDSNLTDYARYIYRLDKVRGQKRFIGEKTVFGYSSTVRKDESENNDSENEASLLEYDLACNLPCVHYINRTDPVIDEDWFYVEVPPLRSAAVVVNQTSGLDNQSTGSDTQLMLLVKGNESVAVKQNIENIISNTTYSTKKMYFKIYPTTTGLFASNNYTAVIEYTISLKQVFKYKS